MEIEIFGFYTILDILDILIGAVTGEVPIIGPALSCIIDFSIKFAELGWNFGIKIPVSCIFGLTTIDRSFYKGIEEFPLVLCNLIRHLFGKG